MFDILLNEFMPSEELREYLKRESISDSDMADIIFYSLTSVERKREALLELEKMDIPEEKKLLRVFIA